MIATVRLHSGDGEELLIVRADDFVPFVSVTLRGQTVDLTVDQARMAGDALRAAFIVAVGDWPWPENTCS
jgi:hypothetical protein